MNMDVGGKAVPTLTVHGTTIGPTLNQQHQLVLVSTNCTKFATIVVRGILQQGYIAHHYTVTKVI